MASNAAVMAATLSHDRADRERTNSRNSEKLMDVHSRENSPLLRSKHHISTPRSTNSAISSNGCLKICVSGRVFELTLEQVRRYPDSLLADPTKMADYFQPQLGMFFFDRNRQVFEYIMQFYQGDGYMEFPDEVPAQLLEIELAFYKIGHRILNNSVNQEEEAINPTFWERGREFFSEPSSSMFAKSWMLLDIFFIITSVLLFMLRTEVTIIDYEEKSENLRMAFWVITIFCAIFFTLDLGGRFVFAEDKLRFFFDVMPWLDIISIVPLYTEIFKDYIDDQGEMLNILKLFRMARVARCLKLIRRSKRLVLIFQILVQCKEELSILLLVWVTGTAISGSIMYYVEVNMDNKLKFYSILESCWWAITTIGTIGYGNIRPVSAIGQILTTIIIFCSMIFMTVPMTIIIRRFSDSYEQFERKKADIKLFGETSFAESESGKIPVSMNNNTWSMNNKVRPESGRSRGGSGRRDSVGSSVNLTVPILVTQASTVGKTFGD